MAACLASMTGSRRVARRTEGMSLTRRVTAAAAASTAMGSWLG